MQFSTTEIIGSLGVALMLCAFLMNLLKKWSEESLPYILLNIIGAALSCASSIIIWFLPFIVLEATWTLVSLAALVNYLRRS